MSNHLPACGHEYTDGSHPNQCIQKAIHEKRPTRSAECHAAGSPERADFCGCDRPNKNCGACNHAFSGCGQSSNRTAEPTDAARPCRRDERNLIGRTDSAVNSFEAVQAANLRAGSGERRRQCISFLGFISNGLYDADFLELRHGIPTNSNRNTHLAGYRCSNTRRIREVSGVGFRRAGWSRSTTESGFSCRVCANACIAAKSTGGSAGQSRKRAAGAKVALGISGLLRNDLTGQLRPNVLPVVRPEVTACHLAIRGSFNRNTQLSTWLFSTREDLVQVLLGDAALVCNHKSGRWANFFHVLHSIDSIDVCQALR